MLLTAYWATLKMSNLQSAERSINQGETVTRKLRVKRYHAKTTTGCMTCRRRRVKCGEEKPVCTKCQRYGVKCDGYLVRNRNMSLVRSRLDKDIDHGHVAFSTLPNSVKTSYGTLDQAVSLDFYLKILAPIFSMVSPVKDLWTVVMPQVSWHFLPIKHMICALSLLDQNLDEEVDVAPRFVLTTGYDKALNEYHRAISAFRASPTHDLSNAILFSFMAWFFDTIINKYDEAMLHNHATRAMLADSKLPGTQLSMQDQLVIERAERMLEQGNVVCGQPDRQAPPRLTDAFTDLQESWRELYYVLERPASDIDVIVASGWDPIRRSLDEWRSAFELYRYVGSASLRQKRAILIAQNMLGTYLASMDPQPMQSSWEEERDCKLILTDLENVVSAYDNLDDIRWIANPMLLHIADMAGGLEEIMSRVRRLSRVLEKSASRAREREAGYGLNFIVSIESNMSTIHAALRQARTLWIKHNLNAST